MLSYLVVENAPWLELLLVLSVGTAVMVGLAALADRLVRSAIWQRTIWQVTTLGVLALVLVELTGTGPALVGLWRARTEAEATQSGAAPLEPIPKPLTPGPSPRERGEGRGLFDRQPTNNPRPSAAAPELSSTEHRGLLEEQQYPLRAGESAESQRTAAMAIDNSSQSGELVAGVERSEPPEPRISGGSLTLDPGHPESGQPLGQASRWLGLIWALGAVLIAARTVCARALLFAFWRRGTRLSDGPLCERAAGLARRLGIRRRVCVLEAVGLSAPVAFGSLRPAVALPATFAEEFDRQQQDAVLAHELAHLAARDPAWQVVAGLLCAALWWHPLVWWSRHRLRAASEAAADEASLLVPDGPDVLAHCLVAMGWRLARVPSGRRQLGWVSFEGPGFRSSLGRRVERLLNLRARSWRAPGRGRLAFAKATLPVALLIVAVSCTAWARSQAPLTEGGTTMSVLRVSWRHSLAAAMLLAFVSPASGDAVADDPPADQSLPAVAGSDLAGAQVQLALLAEGQEREKGEAREDKEREREEGEAREGKEREREEGEAREGKEREREEGEAREGKERKREKGEAREGKEPKREKGEAREGERRAEPRGDLEGQVRELRAQVTELRQQIKELREILKGLLARDRKEGEAREGEKRERKEGEAREGEKRERKEGEAREGEKRDRKEGKTREGEKRERKDSEAREGKEQEREEGDREGKKGKAREDE